MTGPYDDIINLPHHVSTTQPRMQTANRAAQFSPFAALTGYNDAVEETARLTTQRIELDENTLAVLDMKLQILTEKIVESPEIIVTHFVPDGKKDGGKYVDTAGTLKKIVHYQRVIVMRSGEKIAIPDILDIECELFKSLSF